MNKRIYVEGKKKMIQVPDPERSHFFSAMFDLRAGGSLSDAEIVKRVNAMGYLSKSQKRWNEKRDAVIGRSEGKPLSIKQLQRIVQRPIYAGENIAANRKCAIFSPA